MSDDDPVVTSALFAVASAGLSAASVSGAFSGLPGAEPDSPEIPAREDAAAAATEERRRRARARGRESTILTGGLGETQSRQGQVRLPSVGSQSVLGGGR